MVKLYTRPGDAYCDAARRALQEAGDPFEEIDVSSTPGAEEEVKTLTGGPMVLPVVVDGESVRVGYAP